MPRAVNTLCAVTIWYRWILNITNHKFLYNCIISTCLSCPCWLAPRHLRFISRTWFRLLCRRGGSCFSSVGSMDSAACHNPLRWSIAMAWFKFFEEDLTIFTVTKKMRTCKPSDMNLGVSILSCRGLRGCLRRCPVWTEANDQMTLGSYVIITCSYLVKSCLTT